MPSEELGENNPMRNILSFFFLLAWECKHFLVPSQRPTPPLSTGTCPTNSVKTLAPLIAIPKRG